MDRDKRRNNRYDDGDSEFEEKLVKINRCAKVVKGGRNFSFSALVVVGDKKGMVGYGYGKATGVPDAIAKATKKARKAMVKVSLDKETIPFQIKDKHEKSQVLLIPASPGTGVIAGAAVRAVVEAAGVSDILTKVYGSTNSINVVKATVKALQRLKTKEEIEKLRGVSL